MGQNQVSLIEIERGPLFRGSFFREVVLYLLYSDRPCAQIVLCDWCSARLVPLWGEPPKRIIRHFLFSPYSIPHVVPQPVQFDVDKVSERGNNKISKI